MSFQHRVEASRELLGRYRTIFAHFWRHRRELSGKAFAEHEAQFLPAALALQAKPVSPAARLLAAVIMSLITVVIAWSVLGKIDIIVNAQGKIIPSGYSKTIASVDVASVRALYVEEGQQVRAGDVLVELDTSASDAERDKATGDRAMALLQVARANALIAALLQTSGKLHVSIWKASTATLPRSSNAWMATSSDIARRCRWSRGVLQTTRPCCTTMMFHNMPGWRRNKRVSILPVNWMMHGTSAMP
jgi:biotin carboxyl carrier protein